MLVNETAHCDAHCEKYASSGMNCPQVRTKDWFMRLVFDGCNQSNVILKVRNRDRSFGAWGDRLVIIKCYIGLGHNAINKTNHPCHLFSKDRIPCFGSSHNKRTHSTNPVIVCIYFAKEKKGKNQLA